MAKRLNVYNKLYCLLSENIPDFINFIEKPGEYKVNSLTIESNGDVYDYKGFNEERFKCLKCADLKITLDDGIYFLKVFYNKDIKENKVFYYDGQAEIISFKPGNNRNNNNLAFGWLNISYNFNVCFLKQLKEEFKRKKAVSF